MIAALVLGALIGVTLGALGGGGSILAVPALVYVVGEGAAAATTAGLVIVGVAAVSAMAGHARAGNVRWGAAVVFAALGVAASFAGTALNQHLDPQVLLLGFAAIMLLAAVGMVRTSRRPAAPPVAPRRALVGAGTAAPPGTDVPAADGPTDEPVRPTGVHVGRLVAAALVVGFLTGLFGVGGGFVIVPALVVALGFDMPVAVGTSLLVIAINSAVALAARAGHESLHWSVIVPVTVAAVAGSLAGKQIADRVAGATMTRAFAGLLVAVAAYTAIRSGITLAG